MSKTLKDVAYYSTERISLSEISLDNYITTDNLLQNKLGKVRAENLPPQGGHVTKFDVDDILIANIRPYLKKIWLAKYEGGSSADVLILKVNDQNDPAFIYYSLCRDDFFSHVMNGSKGTKMPRGDKNQILNFIIPNFKRNKQSSIAKILSDLDAKITLNNRINQELEAVAKLIYDYWFVQFDFPDENGKPYKSSGGQMVYDEQLKRGVPEGWGGTELREVCYRIQSGGTPLTTEKKYYSGDINWFTTKELQDQFLLGSETKITEKAIEESSAKIFEKNSVVIAIYASPTVGRIGILSEPSSFNQACCGLVVDGQITKEYLFQTLLLYRKKLNVLATGTTQKNLGVDVIKKQKIVVPPQEFMLRYEELSKPIYDKKLALMTENQKLSELRDWLLPMLMNGQVTIKEAEDQWSMAAKPEVPYNE